MALPNAASATAADEKFTKYFFNSKNKEGWAKGIAFSSRLGYNEDNWEELKKEILTSASKYPCNNQGNIVRNGVDYGVRFEQKVVLYGINGKPANVLVGWAKDRDGTHMSTAHIEEVNTDAKN